jgi:serine/threonine-protein kinase
VLSSKISPFADDGLPAIGELVAGKYRIEGSLGEGGMGVVLAARHEAIGQLFAIKFLVVNDEEYRLEAATRLLREARAAASLRGEHVVQVFDVGELPNGTPFIVMERLEGRDLSEILRERGSLPICDALALMVQACHAVSEAHAAGIVHRDLKPSNLFVVRRSDGSALVKVVDFGISKSMRADPVETPTLTGARIALGSPRYMSPEQVRDARAVDTRTDVWSLGVILYELVSGRPAFQASTHSGIYAAIVADAPPSLAAICPAVTPALERVIGRCLERDTSARIQSADELRALLEPWASAAVDFASLVRQQSASGLRNDPETHSRTQPGPDTQRAASEAPPFDANPPATRTQVSPGAPVSSGTALVPAAVHSSWPLSSSAEPATRRSASEFPRYAPRPAARWTLLGLGALALLAIGVWHWRVEPEPAPPPAPVRPAMLSIDSEPPGALVREGRVVYGVTPLQLRLPVPGGSAAPRVFSLELPGFRPYVIEQAELQAPASVRALLVPLVLPGPSASVAPRAAPSGRAAPRAAPPPSAAATSSTDPHWDIRLSR